MDGSPRYKTRAALNLPAGAFLCALLFLLCVLISHPVAEIGINDDWSYIRSAKLMAETGHIHYIGWASAMLGWMLPLGAIFIKLFGFSFTVVRASTVFLGALTAFLLQRTLLRAGLNGWNASLATLTVVLSPLYLPVATTFMTDIPGLIATVLCFYACLRAVEAVPVKTGPDWRAFGWIGLAAASSAIGGTARQTAWFGVIAMVPSALWLMHRRRLPWIACGAVWLLSMGFIYGSLQWFSRQPYSLREIVVAGYVDRDLAWAFLDHAARALLAFCLLLLPLLAAFVPHVLFKKQRVQRWLAASCLVAAGFVLYQAHAHHLLSWLAPFDGNYWTERGLDDIEEIGTRGVMLGPVARGLLTVITMGVTIAAVAHFLVPPSQPLSRSAEPGSELREQPEKALSWHELLVLLVPFGLAYTLLLTHRAIFAMVYDRYLLPLLFVAAPLLARWYQDRVAARLPAVTAVLLLLFGAFTTAANHDLFAMQRARKAAADELIAAGIGRERFFGGWDYDGWTQVDRYGWVNSGAMNTPQGFTGPPPIKIVLKNKPCKYGWARTFPAIRPEYALSFDDISCDARSSFPAVEYGSWLPPYGSRIYIQRVTQALY